MEKRGQSEIITTLIIILIVIVMVIIVWNVVGGMIKTQSGNININPISLNADLSYSLENPYLAVLKVHRGNGKGEIEGVRLVFNLENGEIINYDNTTYSIEPLETREYKVKNTTLNLFDFSNVSSVSVHYIYNSGKITHELDKAEREDYVACTSVSWYIDNDGDNYGNSSDSVLNCANPGGYVSNDDDCNDNDISINPGEAEICGNGIDEDCNGADLVCGVCPDADLDGHTLISCGGDDCNDADNTIYPTRTETFNGIDNNCDGMIDNVDRLWSWWKFEGDYNDSIGNNDLEVHNIPIINDPERGNVSRFTEDGRANINNATFNTLDVLSVFAWVNFDDTGYSKEQIIVGSADHELMNKGWFIVKEANSWEIKCYVYDGERLKNASVGVVNSSTWWNVGCVYGSNYIVPYKNGNLGTARSYNGTIVDNYEQMYIGGLADGSRRLTGKIDDVIFFNKVANFVEIDGIYNSQK